MLFNYLSITQKELESIVKPLIEICDVLLPVLISVVGSIGAIWCVFLGVKYARADDPQEHEKAKNGLKNAIIGFVLIFVLLIAIRIGVVVFENMWLNYDIPTLYTK